MLVRRVGTAGLAIVVERLMEYDDSGHDHPCGRIHSNRRLPTNQVISSLSVIGLEKPMHASVGDHVWLRRREAGFVADPAREALD